MTPRSAAGRMYGLAHTRVVWGLLWCLTMGHDMSAHVSAVREQIGLRHSLRKAFLTRWLGGFQSSRLGTHFCNISSLMWRDMVMLRSLEYVAALLPHRLCLQYTCSGTSCSRACIESRPEACRPFSRRNVNDLEPSCTQIWKSKPSDNPKITWTPNVCKTMAYWALLKRFWAIVLGTFRVRVVSTIQVYHPCLGILVALEASWQFATFTCAEAAELRQLAV